MKLPARLFSMLVVSLVWMQPAHAQIEGIGPTGPVRKVQGDFEFTEGPAWDGQGTLYFTDVAGNRIYQLERRGEISVFLEPSDHANGLMINSAGTIFACQMDGRVVSIDPATKEVSTVTDSYNGRRYNAPNDLVLDRSGGIYFTDPQFRAPQPLPQGITAVYYVNAQGEVSRITDQLPAPNGVILSPDETRLYVIPSMQKEMLVYPVTAPGKVGPARTFCVLKQQQPDGNQGGDGLTIDTDGNLYITSALGVQVFDPQGRALGIISFPEQPANVTFGGSDRRTLFATCRTGLYSAPMVASGHAFPGAEPQ